MKRHPRFAWAVALALATAGGVAACRRSAQAPLAARHLVIVTIDTLRADHVGAYGNSQVETPNLDRIAREGAMALEATAHVPLTRPSHVSLFTGRLPWETGVRDNISPAVIPDTPLIAEVLKASGFINGAFVSSVVLDPSSGLDRGFDTYSARFEGQASEAQFLSTVQKKGDVTLGEAVAWLDRIRATNDQAQRIFLWLHLYDPHDPYEPPEPFATRHAGRPYDGEVAFADELVGRLDKVLARLRLREDTLLIVASDHGEGLGEHRETLHGFFTYQTTLRIPFLVRGPAIPPGQRVAATVRLVDVFPTVLDLLGIPAPSTARFVGADLAPVFRGQAKAAEPVTYAESLVPLLHFGWSDLRVVREGRWKYIHAPRPELYDLQEDPHETTNLASFQSSRAEAMRNALGRFLDAERRVAAGPKAAQSVPGELLEKLGALGYVGGSAPAETRTPGADPKDKIDEFRFANDAIREGLLRFHAKDYTASVALFRSVLRRDISSFEIHFYLARGLYALGRFAEAARHFDEATRRAPAHAEAWEGLGNCQRIAGHLPEARVAFEAALPLAPKSGLLRMELGEVLRDLGKIEEALVRQREAVALEPSVGSYWNSLGMTLGGKGAAMEAEKCFREAWRLDDKNHRHAYNLGLILQRQGRAAEARPFFEAALRLYPAFTPAREKLR